MGGKTRFQIWHLFYLTTIVAVLLGLFRLDITLSGRIVVGVSMLFVVTCGTVLIVQRYSQQGLFRGLAVGGVGALSIAMACLGWMFVFPFLLVPDRRLMILGGLGAFCLVTLAYGAIVGLATEVWRRVVKLRSRQTFALPDRR